MEKTIKKVFRGMAEFRDYDVEKCINDGESLRVKYDEDYMILSPKDLVDKRIATSQLMKSKQGLKDYHLYGYKWEPVEIDY